MHVQLNRTQMLKSHCLYSHICEGVVIYLGICKIKDVMHCPDARRNSAWVELTENDVPVTVQIIAISDNVNDCINERYKQFKTLGAMPYCNAKGSTIASGRTSIKCVETGDIFDTQRQACDVLGLDPANLNKHLRGMPSFKSVKGLTFERV